MEAPKNPLLHDVVLDILFKFLIFDSKNFANYRLVCSVWDNATLRIWRKNVCLNVGYRKNCGDSQVYYLNLLAMLENDERELKSKPFTKFKMDRWQFRHGGVGVSSVTSFWNEVGPIMSHLQISGSTFYGADILRQVLFQFTRNLTQLHLENNTYNGPIDRPTGSAYDLRLPQYQQLPPHEVQKKLKKLTIVMLTAEHGPPFSTVKFPLTWMELIIHFPNIEVLEPLNFGCKGYDELIEIVNATQILRNMYAPNEYLANLKELKLEDVRGLSFTEDEYRCPPALVSSLRQTQFPLKKLSLHVGFEVIGRGEDMFLELLKIHGNSLETLFLTKRVESVSQLIPFDFNLHLDHLTYLQLTGFSFNLLYLKPLQNLKTLLLIFDNPYAAGVYGLRNISVGGFIHESLEEFGVNYRVLSPGIVAQLGSLVPNLKRLTLGLGNDGFTQVCRNWTTLESLTIHPFHVSNNRFLGVQGNEKFCHPNITDLQDLKFFGMGDKVDHILETRLTKASILHGILSLKKLEDAQVRLSPKISDTTSNMLQAKFPKCLLPIRKLGPLS